MSVLIGAGVVAVVAAGYLGRKGWLALHRAAHPRRCGALVQGAARGLAGRP